MEELIYITLDKISKFTVNHGFKSSRLFQELTRGAKWLTSGLFNNWHGRSTLFYTDGVTFLTNLTSRQWRGQLGMSSPHPTILLHPLFFFISLPLPLSLFSPCPLRLTGQGPWGMYMTSPTTQRNVLLMFRNRTFDFILSSSSGFSRSELYC